MSQHGAETALGFFLLTREGEARMPGRGGRGGGVRNPEKDSWDMGIGDGGLSVTSAPENRNPGRPGFDDVHGASFFTFSLVSVARFASLIAMMLGNLTRVSSVLFIGL